MTITEGKLRTNMKDQSNDDRKPIHPPSMFKRPLPPPYHNQSGPVTQRTANMILEELVKINQKLEKLI